MPDLNGIDVCVNALSDLKEFDRSTIRVFLTGYIVLSR